MIRRAFTLVELLIVIIIVAVLASIAIPKFTKQQRASKEATLRSTLRQLREAQQKFHAHYDGWPDDIEDFTDPLPTSRVWTSDTVFEGWGTRVYQGPLLQQGQEIRHHFIKDPVSGNNFNTLRLPTGELRIRSSATGNDSNGIPYSTY
jgi:prepilin-type N-terminal cleavage/methylation domain-containing protein